MKLLFILMATISLTGARFSSRKPLIMAVGDSNTNFEVWADESNYIEVLADSMSSTNDYVNRGKGGDTILDMFARYDGISTWYRPPSYAIVLAGLNDDQDGAPVDTVLKRYWQLCDSLQADGFIVLACTYPVEDNNMFTVNDSIITQWTAHADTLVDCSADAFIGEASDHYNSTWWYNSRHFSMNGHIRFAMTYCKPVLNALGVL